MPELGAGVAGGELPVDLALVGVGGVGPGFEFCVEDVDVGDATPAAVLGGVVDLQSAGEGEGLLGWERLVERGDVVGVEVVHHRGDLVGVGLVDGQQVVDAVGPFDAGPGRFGVGAAPAASLCDSSNASSTQARVIMRAGCVPDETTLVSFARSAAFKRTVNSFGRGTTSTPSGQVSTRGADHK